MGYPFTEGGYNMYDMLSMVQKAIRRGIYEDAGFAANQLQTSYRTALWNRLLVITSEDCYGVLTKEVLSLRRADDDRSLANAVALMCRSLKSRDACYFSCNFVMASRKPREIVPDSETVRMMLRYNDSGKYDEYGFAQKSIFKDGENVMLDASDLNYKNAVLGASLHKAMEHRDIDMVGWYADQLRGKEHRRCLWNTFELYARLHCVELLPEIEALRSSDDLVNKRKTVKDEIFISKAIMLMLYRSDERYSTVLSSPIVNFDQHIDWSEYDVKPIESCEMKQGKIPDWVYDCHTIKGKKMGKTDWDMTMAEQAALVPLQRAYFDDASWIYTYEQDFEKGDISLSGIETIREYAKTHLANPVEFVPYND